MSHLLIVDDEPSICWGLARLAEELGHSAITAASAEQGLAAARARRPDAIVLDVRLPGMSGIAAMQHFHQTLGPLPIIIITAFGDLATAVEAVRHGAFEYLLKPFDLAVAQRAIERALGSRPASAETAPALPLPPDDGRRWSAAVTAMQEVFKRIAVVAPSDACVHLRGESGTGKELAARAIHRYSRRSAGPFVAVNVASLSPVAGRKRTVRACPRRVHRGRSAAQGFPRTGRRRHDLPRRSGRHSAGLAGETAPRAWSTARFCRSAATGRCRAIFAWSRPRIRTLATGGRRRLSPRSLLSAGYFRD